MWKRAAFVETCRPEQRLVANAERATSLCLNAFLLVRQATPRTSPRNLPLERSYFARVQARLPHNGVSLRYPGFRSLRLLYTAIQVNGLL